MTDTLTSPLETETIQIRLDALRRGHPDLANACTYYREIFPLLKQAQTWVLPFPMDATRAQQKLERGIPVLRGERLPFSSLAAQNLFRKICEAIATAGAVGPRTVQKIRTGQLKMPDELPLMMIMDALLNGSSEPMARTARDLDLDPVLLRVVVQNCLKPFLYVWVDELSPRINLTRWNRGRCPFCGSAPVFAELRGPQRTHYLRCGLCGADWPFSRPQCAYCESFDMRRLELGLLQPEGKNERAFVQACDACHTYIKTMVTSEPVKADLLLVEDLSSLTLDHIASQCGYMRPG